MKKNVKRALSLVLSMALLITTCCFFNVGVVKSEAASSKAASIAPGTVSFIVPEMIYLVPDALSWRDNSTTNFQYYVNNTSAGATTNTRDTTGKIYYSFSGAANATISYRFIDLFFSNELVGGTVSLSATSIANGGSINITGGKSPSLTASTQGCYIEWTLSFTDSADGIAKKAYAYTYVYKPYVVPVGGITRVKNTDGNDHFGQSFAWLSGVHSINAPSSGYHDDGGYYPKYRGGNGMSGFITADNAAMIGTSTCTPGKGARYESVVFDTATKHSAATKWNLAFMNGSDSTARFIVDCNNTSATGWFSTNANDANVFNVKSFDYWYREGSSTNEVSVLLSAAQGLITIDTSRYSDLAQVPNLAGGLMTTDDQSSKWGNWYVADYTRISGGFQGLRTTGTSSDRNTHWNDKAYIIAGEGTGSPTDTHDGNDGRYENEGVKYAGPWPRTLLSVPAGTSTSNVSNTYTYTFKGYYGNEEDSSGTNDMALNHMMIDLKATQVNKSALRTSVQNATKAMARMGINGTSSGIGKPTSVYFDTSGSYGLTNFQTKYQMAVRGLTCLDNSTFSSSQNLYTLASDLNSAMDALKTKVTLNANGGSLSTTELWLDVGTTTGVNTSVSCTPNVTPTRTGYKFLGWSLNQNATTGSATVNVGYNNTLYAIWAPITYKVVYNGNGSTSGSTQESTHTYNAPKPLTQNGFTRSFTVNYNFNYSGATNQIATATSTFNGWATTATGNVAYTDSQQVTNLTTTDNATINLYARWTDESLTLPTPTRTGYTFGGWFREAACTNVVGAGGATYTPTQTITMYAKWTVNSYTVTLNKQNGTGGDSNVTAVFDSAMPNATMPSRVGYSFGGYFTSSSGNGTKYYTETGASARNWDIGSNTTLYAYWIPNTNTAYSVNVFVQNVDGTYPASPTYGPKLLSGTTNSSVTLSAETIKGWGGYWPSTAPEQFSIESGTNTGTILADGTAVINVKLKRASHTITYDYATNGGTAVSTATETVLYGAPAAMTAVASKDGWTFVGWAASPNSTTKLSYYTMGTQNIVLYAIYSKALTGTFVDYNGSTMATRTVSGTLFNNDTSVTLTAPSQNAYTGWTAKGWATGTSPDASVVTNFTINADTTYYGLYQKTVVLSYNADGGDTTPASQSITQKANSYSISSYSNPTVNLAGAITKTGYTFSKWAVGSANGTAYAPGAPISITSNTTMYPVWNANTITVNFNGNGATGGSTTSLDFEYDKAKMMRANSFTRSYIVTYDYGGTVSGSAPAKSTATYTFANWNNLADGTGEYSYTSGQAAVKNPNGVTEGSTTLYAIWNPARVTLPNPIKNGFTFEGWYTNPSFTGTRYLAGELYTPTDSITMYAKWEANKFAMNLFGWLDGVESDDLGDYGTVDLYIDGVKIADDVTDFNELGSFGSTYEIKDFKPNLGYTYVGLHSGALSGTISAPVMISLEFRKNKSTLLVNPSSGNWNGFTTAQTYTLPYGTQMDIPAPTRTGYVFNGWTRTNSNGTLTSLTENATYTFGSADGTLDMLVASWSISRSTLVVDPNGGKWNNSTAVQSFTQNYNTTKLVPLPTREGYTFAGWVLSDNFNGTMPTLTASTSYRYSENDGITDTITASWIANEITVSFNGNGNTSGTTANQVFAVDSAQPISENGFVRAYNVTYNYGIDGTAPETAVAAYTFNRWNNAADGSGSYSYNAGENVTNPNGLLGGTAALYAIWTPAEITLPTPTRENYIFDGWYEAADFSGTKLDGGATITPSEDMEFYAKWIHAGSISFINGAESFESSGVKYVHGLKTQLTKGQLLNNYISAENATVTVQAATGSRYLGTGSVITVTSDVTGEVIDQYIIVIYGDVNGNGSVDASDVSYLNDVIEGKAEMTSVEQNLAANVFGTTAMVDTQDLTVIAYIASGEKTLDQLTGNAE